MRSLLTIVVAALATACGPLAQDKPILGAFPAIDSLSIDLFAGIPKETNESSVLAANDAGSADQLLFARVDEDMTREYVRVARNGGVDTWISDGGASLSLRNGLVVATRGEGDDLMGLDYADVYSALVAGSGSAVRVHAYLGGDDQVYLRTYQCEVATVRSESIEILQYKYRTNVIRETCTQNEASFINYYWINSAGMFLQSRQWISPTVGAVDIQRVKYINQ